MSSGDVAGFLEACKAGDDGQGAGDAGRGSRRWRPAARRAARPRSSRRSIEATSRSSIAWSMPARRSTSAPPRHSDARTSSRRAFGRTRPACISSRTTGWTPLHLAAFFGHAAVVTLLLEGGADLDAVSGNGMRNTALHAAVAGGRVDAALTLIDAGRRVNAPDGGGHTPLHIAAEGGYVPIVEALLQHHADPHAVDAEDRTPLARAAARNHTAVIDLFTLSESGSCLDIPPCGAGSPADAAPTRAEWPRTSPAAGPGTSGPTSSARTDSKPAASAPPRPAGRRSWLTGWRRPDCRPSRRPVPSGCRRRSCTTRRAQRLADVDEHLPVFLRLAGRGDHPRTLPAAGLRR